MSEEKTFTQAEVEAEMSLSARDLTDPKLTETSEERSAKVADLRDRMRRRRDQDEKTEQDRQDQEAENERIAKEAGATIRGPKGRTAEQNIQKQKDVAASKDPLKQAKPKRFRKVYTPAPAPQTAAQSEQARLNKAKKVIENSDVVEVS